MDISFLALYVEFFKIGLFAVGGGLATLPFLYDMAGRYAWLAAPEIPSMLAVAQLLPGAIGINLGAYAASFAPLAGLPPEGAARHIAGAVTGPLGMVTPQIIVILIVSRVLNTCKESRLLEAVFTVLRPAACGLLAAAGFLILRECLYNEQAAQAAARLRPAECILFALILAAVILFKKHPVFYIGAAALAGIALKL